jgi:hypothetical protein
VPTLLLLLPHNGEAESAEAEDRAKASEEHDYFQTAHPDESDGSHERWHDHQDKEDRVPLRPAAGRFLIHI